MQRSVGLDVFSTTWKLDEEQIYVVRLQPLAINIKVTVLVHHIGAIFIKFSLMLFLLVASL